MTGGEKERRKREELRAITSIANGGSKKLVEFVVEVGVGEVVFGHEDEKTVESQERDDSTSIVRISKEIA